VRLATYDLESHGERGLPEVVTGEGDVSGVVSATAQHEPAGRGLGLAPGVVMARPDLLAAHLEVAAARHGALVLAVIVKVAIVVTTGPHHFHWKIRRRETFREYR